MLSTSKCLATQMLVFSDYDTLSSCVTQSSLSFIGVSLSVSEVYNLIETINSIHINYVNLFILL